MSRKISLVIGVAVAALTIGAPVVSADAWYADQTKAPDAFERAVAAGNGGTTGISPDAFERAVAVGYDGTASMLDARERSLTAKPLVEQVSPLDRREAAFHAKREAQVAGGGGLDAFERTVLTSTRESIPVADDRFRIDPTTSSVPVNATSGRELEWPQIGIGLGIGLLLGLGVMLAMRYTRIRPLAH